jgi:hypothetical protein
MVELEIKPVDDADVPHEAVQVGDQLDPLPMEAMQGEIAPIPRQATRLLPFRGFAGDVEEDQDEEDNMGPGIHEVRMVLPYVVPAEDERAVFSIVPMFLPYLEHTDEFGSWITHEHDPGEFPAFM